MRELFSNKDAFMFDKKFVISFPDNCSVSYIPFQAKE